MISPHLVKCTLCVLMTTLGGEAPLSINDSAPVLSEKSEVFLKGLTWSDPFEGLALKVSDQGVVTKTPVGQTKSPGDFHWNDKRQALSFSVLDIEEGAHVGVYEWKSGEKDARLVYDAETIARDLQVSAGAGNPNGISFPVIANSVITARYAEASTKKRYLARKNLETAAVTTVLKEVKDQLAYIFVPATNSAGITAVKVKKGRLDSDDPEVYLRIDADGKTTELFTNANHALNNSAAINLRGDIAVLANSNDQERRPVLMLSLNEKEGLTNMSIPFPEGAKPYLFRPAINDLGEVAVIAQKGGKDMILVWKDMQWRKIAESETEVQIAGGKAKISSQSPAFHSGLALNNKSEVAVLVGLEDSTDGSDNAVLLIRPTPAP